MKALLFDIDGTLIESMAVDTELYFASIREIIGPVRVRDALSDYDDVTDSGILAQLLEDNGRACDDGIVAAIQSVFVDRIDRHMKTAGPFPAIDGAVEFVKKARAADDRRIAIATGGWRDSALLKLESAGFEVDGIPLVTSDDSPSRTEIMRIALARLGGNFESITYFGDADWDRHACRDLGWEFVAVGPGLDGISSFAEAVT